MNLRLEDILTSTKGHLLSEAVVNDPIHRVWTDSRTINKGDIFVALSGERFDGHDFVKEAIEKGVRSFVVSNHQKIDKESRQRANFVVVSDALAAYGDLARFWREQFKIGAVAITGSCGKTTVKELIAHILSARMNCLKNRGTENNLIGVPKTILQLDASHQVLVLEMGTSAPGEIERLSSIIRPQVGVLTRIGCSHLEGLKSSDGVFQEKTRIIRHLDRGGLLFVNGQDPYLAGFDSGVHQVIRVGFEKDKNVWVADQVWSHGKRTAFRVNGKDQFETQLIGRYNVLNCLLAIGVASAFEIETAAIQKALADFKPIAGRMALRNMEGITFMDDSYNANPVSFKAALETLKHYKMRGRKAVVCGDMLELGDQSEQLHRKLGTMIAEFLFDYVIAVGPNSRFVAEEAVKAGFDPNRLHYVKDSIEAGQLCRSMAVGGDLILVKGSRSMKMEKVFECFITS